MDDDFNGEDVGGWLADRDEAIRRGEVDPNEAWGLQDEDYGSW